MHSTGFRSKSMGLSLFVAGGSSPERNSRYAQKSAIWPMSNEVRHGYNVAKVSKSPGSVSGWFLYSKQTNLGSGHLTFCTLPDQRSLPGDAHSRVWP